MKLIHFYKYICTLQLWFKFIDTKIETSFVSNENLPWKRMESLIENCFNVPLGVSILMGNMTVENKFILKSFFSALVPLVVFETDDKLLQHQRIFKVYTDEAVSRTDNFPATNVTIITSTITTLFSILSAFKKSIWWNHEAFILVINTDLKGGCISANDFLKLIWSFNILSALYFCVNRKNKLVSYNYNPYNNFSTDFWSSVRDASNDRWTLFEHTFQLNDSLNCYDLYFDKTRNMNGFNVKSGLYNKYNHEYIHLYRTIFKEINATVTIKYYPSFGFVSKHRPRGFLKDALSGELDLTYHPMFLRNYWKIQSYPIKTFSLSIITKNHVNYKNVFFSIFDVIIWIYTTIICYISIIVLKYILHVPLGVAVLEFLRIFSSSPTFRTPRTLLSRLYFIIILVIAQFTNSYIQSQLSALKTIPDFNTDNIDSVDDLINSNISIYGAKNHVELIYSKSILKRYNIIPDLEECLLNLNKGMEIACIAHSTFLDIEKYVEKFKSGNLHIAKNKLLIRPAAITLSLDWPLYSKFNSYLRSTIETGILKEISTLYGNNYHHIEKKNSTFSVRFEDTRSYLILFSSGLMIALCVVFIEIIVFKGGCPPIMASFLETIESFIYRYILNVIHES